MFKNLLFQILGEAFDDHEVDVAAAVKEQEIDVKNEPDEGTESMKKRKISLFIYLLLYLQFELA